MLRGRWHPPAGYKSVECSPHTAATRRPVRWVRRGNISEDSSGDSIRRKRFPLRGAKLFIPKLGVVHVIAGVMEFGRVAFCFTVIVGHTCQHGSKSIHIKLGVQRFRRGQAKCATPLSSLVLRDISGSSLCLRERWRLKRSRRPRFNFASTASMGQPPKSCASRDGKRLNLRCVRDCVESEVLKAIGILPSDLNLALRRGVRRRRPSSLCSPKMSPRGEAQLGHRPHQLSPQWGELQR